MTRPVATGAPATWPLAIVARRKVGRGYKTTAADEITWAGTFRGAAIHAVTRVRCIDPLEGFMTNSGMRLRDSFVGRGGHFVDLCVHTPIADEDLRELEALARLVDARPVVARRRGEALRRPP